MDRPRKPRPSFEAAGRTLVAALLLCFLAAGALAYGADPNPDDPGSLSGDPATDIWLTPAPYEGKAGRELWKQVAGASFGEDEVSEDQGPTAWSTNLYTVTFYDELHGFAGGSEERDCPAGKVRVPVIYEYLDDERLTPEWHRVYIGQCDEKGFVGALGFTADGTGALAVGGDGSYPYRNMRRKPGETYEEWVARDADGREGGAGMAMAWRYTSAAWAPMDLSSERARGMRALTAVAFDPNPDVGTPEWGAAGGLGQIWTWRGGIDGDFTDVLDRRTEQVHLDVPTGPFALGIFRYRVRRLRFVPGVPHALVGATDGCCGPRADDADGTPAADLGLSGSEDVPALLYYAPAYDRWFARTFGDDPRVPDRQRASEDVAATMPATPSPELPDSYYDVAVSGPGDGSIRIAVTATPGGPEATHERASVMSPATCMTTTGSSYSPFSPTSPNFDEPAVELLHNSVSTARLVAADGDTAAGVMNPPATLTGSAIDDVSRGRNPDPLIPSIPGSPGTVSSVSSPGSCHEVDGRPKSGADGIADWAVGELRSTRREGLGARALGYTTALGPWLYPGVLPAVDPNEPVQLPDGTQGSEYIASQYFLLPSYSLNAFDAIDGSEAGWAVGEHGAILKLDGSAQDGAGKRGSGEPDPPGLEPAQPTQPADTSPYGTEPTPGTRPGLVPPLMGRPLMPLEGTRLVPSGSPALQFGETPDVKSIVMSRDGSEGWALGAATVWHYTGGAWRLCDEEGVAGQLSPDPACSGLAGLIHYRRSDGRTLDLKLSAAARIPLENDSDPSNDDEFEVVAVSENSPWTNAAGNERSGIVIYREGRWVPGPASEREALWPGINAIAFTAPNDGWALDRLNRRLYRFDGNRWEECKELVRNCEDPDNRLDLDTTAATTFDIDHYASGIAAAGDRVYLYGARAGTDGRLHPMIIFHDRGGTWSAEPGGDPAFESQTDAPLGVVHSLAVGHMPSGYRGWAAGVFGGTQITAIPTAESTAVPDAVLMRLDAGRWARGDDTGPVRDHLSQTERRWTTQSLRNPAVWPALVVADGSGTGPSALVAGKEDGRLIGWFETRHRWEVIDANRAYGGGTANRAGDGADGQITALSPDGRGGAWASVSSSPGRVYFFNYTDRVHKSVFEDAPVPLTNPEEHLTALAGNPSSTAWAGTGGGRLLRHRRATGWDVVPIAGWDPGLVTRATPVDELAVNAAGVGVAVGGGGRIADISDTAVRLDPASGRSCAMGASPPCSTGRDLVSAAVAPSGAAMVGGDHLALLWRDRPGGVFQAIAPPRAENSATITAVSMPSAERAWVATDTGLIFGGVLSEAGWAWRQENLDAKRRNLGRPRDGNGVRFQGIALDSDWRGYAVGKDGVVLYRDGDGDPPWRRLRTDLRADLTTVALADGVGPGALIGGHNGLILTADETRVERARVEDYASDSLAGISESTGPIAGFAWGVGSSEGSVEAWAAAEGGYEDRRVNAVDRMFHYASDSKDPATNPGIRVRPLPDRPDPRPGELSFAVFGNTGCAAGDNMCMPFGGTHADNELIAKQVVGEIKERASRPGGPLFTIFTGDTVGKTSLPASDAAEKAAGPNNNNNRGPVLLRSWRAKVAGPLLDAGLPLFAAIGGRDLSDPRPCSLYTATPPGPCNVVQYPPPPGADRTGENLMWRRAFAGMQTPWGSGDGSTSNHGLVFRPVEDTPPSSEASPVDGVQLTGGARTHYAFDIVRGGKAAMRVVLTDSSTGSLSGSDPQQNPHETSPQLTWLQHQLCREGDVGGCTRGKDEPAVVVTNTPPYSFGPGQTETNAADGAQLEALLIKEQATALVSGRIGWNGLAWAISAGVHSPCVGDEYSETPPADSGNPCGTEEEATGVDPSAELAAALRGLGAPPPPESTALPTSALQGLLPEVIAGGGGRALSTDGGTSRASDGFWRGYTVIRVDASGDPAATIVEQRPIFHWISLQGRSHVVYPGQRLKLRGYGREPIGYPAGMFGGRLTQTAPIREIDGPGITHRYDLLEADPDRPYLPKTDPDGGYVMVDPSVATIDQTGKVTTGRRSHERLYALALLSVGERAASWPLVFEPKRSHVPKVPKLITAPAVPPIRVLGLSAASIQPPAQGSPAATPPPPVGANLAFPSPPALPTFPTASAPPVAPPAPPAPPPPPAQHQAPALDLSVSPAGVVVPPTPGVTAQPTPPVNPAPPGGARKEARQKQAATAKSEEGASEQAGDATGDLTGSPGPPGGLAFTARDRIKVAPDGFTPLTPRAQPSAWTTGLQWGGGTVLMALVLAFGFVTVRPTPRRRQSPAPAPAWLRRR